MKHDIFIDTNIASRFTNPMDPGYIALIQWLLTFNPESGRNAFLVVSKKLLAEYHRSSVYAHTHTCIAVIINTLLMQGRLTIITNNQIKSFQQSFFTKKVLKVLHSNHEDRNHIPVVLLSDRKYALSIDEAFCHDLIHFPGFVVRVEKRPENLPYNQ